MSLIIKDKLQQMFVGYPTKAQNYNVTGGILEAGSNPVKFGDIVCFGTQQGFYKPFESGDTLADIAGIVLATNVKQAEGFGNNLVQVNPEEAFNLCLYDSYLAVELTDASISGVAPKGQVYVNATTGKFTSSSANSAIALTGVIFTGLVEMHGSKVVAEIYVK